MGGYEITSGKETRMGQQTQIKINIKYELSGLKKDFVGFSATKVDQKHLYSKDLSKVLGVDVIRE